MLHCHPGFPKAMVLRSIQCRDGKETAQETLWAMWQFWSREIHQFLEWVFHQHSYWWDVAPKVLFLLKVRCLHQWITIPRQESAVAVGSKTYFPERKISPDNTVSHTQNYLALLPSLHPWWPWLRLLNCACACSTMLKERGKWLQLRLNIPNIPENKKNVERMLKQNLEAFKLFQHRLKIAFQCGKGRQTLLTLPFNKIEKMLKRMLKPLARALTLI